MCSPKVHLMSKDEVYMTNIRFCFKCLRFCYLTFSSREAVMGWVSGKLLQYKVGDCAPKRKNWKVDPKESMYCNFPHIFLYFQFSFSHVLYCLLVDELLCFQTDPLSLSKICLSQCLALVAWKGLYIAL